jgi:hypothetical protein
MSLLRPHSGALNFALGLKATLPDATYLPVHVRADAVACGDNPPKTFPQPCREVPAPSPAWPRLPNFNPAILKSAVPRLSGSGLRRRDIQIAIGQSPPA